MEADQAPRVTVSVPCHLCDEPIECAVTTEYRILGDPLTMYVMIHSIDLEAHLLSHI